MLAGVEISGRNAPARFSPKEKPTKERTKKTSARSTRPGTAKYRAAVPTTQVAQVARRKSFFLPESSAMAPTIGERVRTIRLPRRIARPQRESPRPAGATSRVK
jgi:hypothetical protein